MKCSLLITCLAARAPQVQNLATLRPQYLHVEPDMLFCCTEQVTTGNLGAAIGKDASELMARLAALDVTPAEVPFPGLAARAMLAHRKHLLEHTAPS